MSEQTGYEADEPQVVTPDAAFVESAGHALNGLELQPWTIERQWAADAMGMRYGRLSRSLVKQFMANNTYPGMAGDVGMAIWLCAISEGEVRAARRNPDDAEALAGKFAVEHKLAHPRQKNFQVAYDIFLSMMDELYVSYSEPDIEKKTESPTTK